MLAVAGGYSHVFEALCQTILVDVRVERVGLHVLLVVIVAVALVGRERDGVHTAHAALPTFVTQGRQFKRRLARWERWC